MDKVIAVDFDGILCNTKFPEANSQNWMNKFFLWYVKRKQAKAFEPSDINIAKKLIINCEEITLD